MDIIVVSLFAFFLYSKEASWRIPLEFALFYGLRFACLAIFAMRTPQGFYWEYPGFYSLTVPYGWTNDFFYSGHIGACILCLLEFWPYPSKDATKANYFLCATSFVSLLA